jgi:membrane-bound serine protease (ClpP class)
LKNKQLIQNSRSKNRLPRVALVLTALFFLQFTDTSDITGFHDKKDREAMRVYIFDIKKEIGPAVWRITRKAMEEAHRLEADLILIHMNTYGGMVNIADSIRTRIINSKIPVYVFIDNNAASAGALISIACDRIYMRKGANIGAATVVTQDGQAAPDKYQSYMRSTMRATAESHGSDTIINQNDTVVTYFRNPRIAEAMVDQRIEIEGVTKEGEVLTFTSSEAIKHGFCEGIAENIPGVLRLAGVKNYEIREYKITGLEKVIGFLVNPILQGLLIMIIIGGIYFELQTPGVGFPLIAAGVAAVIYFAPAYLEGLAQNWEIAIFIAGIILLIIEIFVIPGFGVAGIAGIIAMITGLSLSIADEFVFDFEFGGFNRLIQAFATVIFSSLLSFVLLLLFARKAFDIPFLSRFVLSSSQETSNGYSSVDSHLKELIGKEGVAQTVLRPAGKIIVDNEQYDARSEIGFIEKGEKVKVISCSSTQLNVIKI